MLLQALVIALANLGLGAGWSALLVGVAVAGIGAMLVMRGKSELSPSELAPTRTATQLRKDASLPKEQTR